MSMGFLSQKRSPSVNLSMEQRIVIRIAMEDGLNAIETHQKLVDRYGQDGLS
jgi:hypothetical protein